MITNDAEWGGWRVPGAEYDLYPERIEHQARVIVSAPRLAAIARSLVDALREAPGVTVVSTGAPGAQTSVFLRG
ncbi:MAG TPA: hypothetical protein DCL48_01615, partial [Alphaproteobacteria bacterium]|nr:hypothetical protein [Alphaproteobacteria bacterium]